MRAPSKSTQRQLNQAWQEAASAPRVIAQRDLAVQLSCRMGDGAYVGAHAESLKRDVVHFPPYALLRLRRDYGNRFVQRKVDLSRREEGEGGASQEIEQSIQAARGVRAQMEPAFGTDLGGIRVDNDAQTSSTDQARRLHHRPGYLPQAGRVQPRQFKRPRTADRRIDPRGAAELQGGAGQAETGLVR